ncbi:MAG TPA: cytochrome c [Candidatus Sulfotelmatobacter sp.]|nr:cytochrome c [Candidatus Sulfotelmatobacter sp.]
MKARVLAAFLFCMLAPVSFLFAGSNPSGKESAPAPVVKGGDEEYMRIEGEKRFRANCGRCHAAPQKFPPRMMATVLRHMRVRATITDEDRRLVLFYMTQ